jgi:tRNA (uracil-5-)-methyltransferase TRM9
MTANGATPDIVLANFFIFSLLLITHIKFSRFFDMSEIRDTYDRIAPGWYNYRHHTRFRTELDELARRWGQGRLLNIGCAHGPDFVPFRGSFELHGIDISARMLGMGLKYAEKFDLAVNLAAADAINLPYADNSFDFAIAVAAYHHIEGKEERPEAFRELYRVLKPGGEAFLTVWNRSQPRFWRRGKSVSVPWRPGEKTVYRHYYLFSYGEITRLVKKAGFQVVKSAPEKAYRLPLKHFSRNICLLLKKTTETK